MADLSFLDKYRALKQEYPAAYTAAAIAPVTGQVLAVADYADAMDRGDTGDAIVAAGSLIPGVKLAKYGNAIAPASLRLQSQMSTVERAIAPSVKNSDKIGKVFAGEQLAEYAMKKAEAGAHDHAYSTPNLLDKAVYAVRGAGGAYQPFLDSATIPQEAIDNDGYSPSDVGQNVIAHELEHKRQFNYPGDYFSRDAIETMNGFDKRTGGTLRDERGYGKSDIPLEVLAHMKGANAADDSGGLRQAQNPHPAHHLMTNKEKLFVAQAEQAHLTNQDFLNNVSEYGIDNAKRIQRVKNIAKSVIPNVDAIDRAANLSASDVRKVPARMARYVDPRIAEQAEYSKAWGEK